jgi:hypothetical protein
VRQVPIVFANGNHDLAAVNVVSQFALPGDEEFFSIDYGPLHVTVANDSVQDAQMLTTKGAPFLMQDFTASDSAPWRFLLHHRPMFSASAGHGSNVDIQTAWEPIVDAHKIDVVINGHDHDYERTKPIRAGATQASPADGTLYFVIGTAGAPLYDSGMQPFTQTSSKSYCMGIFKLRAGSLDLKVYDDSGSMIDALTYTK